ncbi:hypothetical protein, partial [Endozoicomonas sp. ONNA2]|uniref:hypothetical protein n=1 Tax=Endozoicomonas sp. ONNA2 TaxID=2828741 RepID=UPI0021473BD0
MKICVLRGELKAAEEFKTHYRAKLDTTTFQTVLQEMALRLNEKKAELLLNLVMPDDDAQDIALKILAEVLQTRLPKAKDMGVTEFCDTMSFTKLFFRHGIVNSALIDTAMRFYMLRGQPKKAQEIKSEFIDQTDQAVGSSHQARPQLLQPALDEGSLRAQLLEAIKNSNMNTVYWLKNQAAMHDIVSPATWQEALNVALDCENPDIVAALLS